MAQEENLYTRTLSPNVGPSILHPPLPRKKRTCYRMAEKNASSITFRRVDDGTFEARERERERGRRNGGRSIPKTVVVGGGEQQNEIIVLLGKICFFKCGIIQLLTSMKNEGLLYVVRA